MNATGQAITAFRESMLNADPGQGRAMFGGTLDEWSRLESREFRYSLNWGMHQNDAYRELVHRWATRLKVRYGTSRHIRHIYNPAERLGNFYQGHTFAGPLDREAGDGESAPSALPIVTENEAIRPAIARLWEDSCWSIVKDILTLWGAVLGDAAIRIVDDPARGQVRKELVYPGHLARVEFDSQHDVKAYLLRRWAEDPSVGGPERLDPVTAGVEMVRPVVYAERCYRDGDLVVFETFKDGKPFAWNGVASSWTEPYGFVPLRVLNHRSVGLDWGVNCFHGGLPQFMEVDDQASVLGDNNRKKLNGPWLMTGVRSMAELKGAGVDRSKRTPAENAADPEPQRSELNLLFAHSVDARAISMTADIDIAGMCEHIRDMLAQIEKRYPEMLADVGMGGGHMTAEAVRNARQIAAARVQLIRPAYDAAEVATNQMALAIGGLRGYPGYEGFGLDSFEAGTLDHSIGHRPVFEVDPLDAINEDQAFWQACNEAVKAGVPLPLYLERNGWSEEDLKALADAKAAEPPPPAPVLVAPPGGVKVNGKPSDVAPA
jgi:hypothetical protein